MDLKLCGNTTFNLEGVKAKGDLYINLVNLGSFTAAEEKFCALFFLSTEKISHLVKLNEEQLALPSLLSSLSLCTNGIISF